METTEKINEKILICNNCKDIWIAPKKQCECGCTTLSETHMSNKVYARNYVKNDTLKSKCDYIVRSIKNAVIREKLDVCFYEWEFTTLVLTTEECVVAINSDEIADAWIKEIDKLKTLYNISYF